MRGEVVLITGGSSGIGLATARRFAGAGARVVLVARDESRLDAAVAELEQQRGVSVRSVAADVTLDEDVDRLVGEIEAAEGRLDVLISGAGAMRVGPADQLGPETADRLMQVNYLGTVRTVHGCLPLLRGGRRRSIVVVTSLSAYIAPPYMSAYAATKAALTGYGRSLRQELRPEGFHVGLLAPGPVDTPMTDGTIRTAHYPIPFGVPVLSPERVGRAVYRMVDRRQAEVVLPRRLGPAARLASAVPTLVDAFYRRFVVS